MTWKKVLRLLASGDNLISGELIGKSMNLTRSAVWKQINFLNEHGFVIESYPKLGYKLSYPKDTPSILESIDIPSLIVGKEVYSKIRTTSTNNDAIAMSEKAVEGTVVIAEHQTAGRGRRGRIWLSPFGRGLYFSIILKPALPVVKLPKMTILAGVAVAKALKNFHLNVRLKWPNDIIVNDKKVGGILSELFVEGDRAKYVILGIGLNVHTEKEEFPDDLKDIAGSLTSETGNVFSRREILKACLLEIDRTYNYFLEKDGELGGLAEQWNNMAWKRGEEVLITTGKEKELCKIIGLREDGVLLVSKNNTVKEVFVGEILF